MNTAAKEKSEDKIINASAELFSHHGINTIGVDMICAEAGVSKRTMYKHFSSKEAVVAAAIQKLGQSWFEACTDVDVSDPAERIMHIFKMVEPMAEVEDFYGCILMNTSVELRGSRDLALEVARDFKGRLYTYFLQQATLLGASEPDIVAEQLVLLYDGTSAWIVMRRKFPRSTFRTLHMLLRSIQSN